MLCIRCGCTPCRCPKAVKIDKHDIVNNPHHYIADNGMECIDVIEAFHLGFRLGNVLKYLLRAEKKGGTESLKKAQWYLNREISKREEQSK